MTSKIVKVLRNRDFILLMGLVLGLFFDHGAVWTESLVIPVLCVVMTLSTIVISSSLFRSPRSLIRPFIVGVFMNYVILTGTILAMASVMIHDDALWSGFVILAAVPPAVAIIPFADFLKGERLYSLIGTIGGYLSGLFVMPVIASFFLRTSISDPRDLLTVIIELIVAPFLISRVLIWTRLDKPIAPYKGTITNWCFFLVVYTVVGLNQEHFVHNPAGLIPIILIAISSTFILGSIIQRICRIFRLEQDISTSLMLLGTLKNYGLAAGGALALFGKQTALPATVSTVFMIVYVIWLNYRARVRGRA